MDEDAARAKAKQLWGGLAYVRRETISSEKMLDDGSIVLVRFHEVFSSDRHDCKFWGIGEDWESAFADAERRGDVSGKCPATNQDCRPCGGCQRCIDCKGCYCGDDIYLEVA